MANAWAMIFMQLCVGLAGVWLVRTAIRGLRALTTNLYRAGPCGS